MDKQSSATQAPKARCYYCGGPGCSYCQKMTTSSYEPAAIAKPPSPNGSRVRDMGSKFKPWQNKAPKNRSRVARSMIENGTGKGGPMRDRRDRRSKDSNRFDSPLLFEDEDASFYDDDSSS